MEGLGQDFLTSLAHWQQTVITNIPNIVIALIVLLVAFFVDDRAQRAVERLVGLRNGQREIARLLGRLARIGVLIFALLIIVSIFRLTAIVTSFVASLGIAGLVIAFALQDITKNFAAGVLLLILRPFRLDDTIKVKEFEGTVTDISLRATTLRTSDGVEVLVPNADVYGSPITNLTRYARRRYHVPIKVPDTLPVEQVRLRLEVGLRAQPGIESEPAAEVVVTGLEDNSVLLDAQYWLLAQATGAAQIRSQVVERLRQLLVAHKQPTAEQAEQQQI